ncbi:hypothetical protein CCACVL1_17518 [Corchorus capsularis]|uniref:Uncharacterized protein n=1 Tax=Corchorus capsularis TaxID=210143 RepID=A0A1R3HRH4_COCAP|nr:hypothetical protein CCACVL1_17518 [Corchorus capsularis]
MALTPSMSSSKSVGQTSVGFLSKNQIPQRFA